MRLVDPETLVGDLLLFWLFVLPLKFLRGVPEDAVKLHRLFVLYTVSRPGGEFVVLFACFVFDLEFPLGIVSNHWIPIHSWQLDTPLPKCIYRCLEFISIPVVEFAEDAECLGTRCPFKQFNLAIIEDMQAVPVVGPTNGKDASFCVFKSLKPAIRRIKDMVKIFF